MKKLNVIGLRVTKIVLMYANEIISGYKAIMQRCNVIELEDNKN